MLGALLNPADNKVLTQVLLEEAKQIKFSTGSVKGKKAKIQETILMIKKKIDPIKYEHLNIYKQLCTAVK